MDSIWPSDFGRASDRGRTSWLGYRLQQLESSSTVVPIFLVDVRCFGVDADRVIPDARRV